MFGVEMMNANRFALLCTASFLMISAIACAAANGDPSQKEIVIFPEQGAVLAPSDIPKLEKEALLGSAVAAHKLATYFGVILLNNKQAIYWTQIRMENGDRDARYDLGAFLSSEHDKASRIRARYWLEAVSKDGSPDLADLARHVLVDLDNAEARTAKNNP
jgi:TPR repeat protein